MPSNTAPTLRDMPAVPDATPQERGDLSDPADVTKPGPQGIVGPTWDNNIVSEAFYTLCNYRTGTSHAVLNGLAMGDWDWPHSDAYALNRVTTLVGGPANASPLNLWNGYRQCGPCKFFVNLVLYRSSYGYPGGHLKLPGGTYSYPSPQPITNAQPGWIIQSSYPHTAIVVARFSWGLDVIDSNYTGGDGHYAISRHPLSWSQLSGYVAYRANEACVLVQ